MSARVVFCHSFCVCSEKGRSIQRSDLASSLSSWSSCGIPCRQTNAFRSFRLCNIHTRNQMIQTQQPGHANHLICIQLIRPNLIGIQLILNVSSLKSRYQSKWCFNVGDKLLYEHLMTPITRQIGLFFPSERSGSSAFLVCSAIRQAKLGAENNNAVVWPL